MGMTTVLDAAARIDVYMHLRTNAIAVGVESSRKI